MTKDLRCVMVYGGVATTPSGGLYPCCRCTYDNMYWGEPKDYMSSSYVETMKEQMRQGIWPKICQTCARAEDNGIISKRERRNKWWMDEGHSMDDLESVTEVRRIDLRLSNLCNLACCSCDGKDSSMLTEESVKFYDTIPRHLKMSYDANKDKNLREPYSEEHVNQLIEMISPNSEVYITGGEPSLIKGVSRLLERLIEKGYNRTVKLQFNSNFAAFNQQWINLVSEFDQGHMMISVDATKDVAEYVRYHSKWDKIDTNVKNFLTQSPPGWQTSIFVTPSALNAFNLKHLTQWFYEELKPLVPRTYTLNLTVENFLTRPNYFSMSSLSDNAKLAMKAELENIIKSFPLQGSSVSDFNEIIKYMMIPGRSDMHAMIDALERFDKMRGTNWRTVLPELDYHYKEYCNER